MTKNGPKFTKKLKIEHVFLKLNRNFYHVITRRPPKWVGWRLQYEKGETLWIINLQEKISNKTTP